MQIPQETVILVFFFCFVLFCLFVCLFVCFFVFVFFKSRTVLFMSFRKKKLSLKKRE